MLHFRVLSRPNRSTTVCSLPSVTSEEMLSTLPGEVKFDRDRDILFIRCQVYVPNTYLLTCGPYNSSLPVFTRRPAVWRGTSYTTGMLRYNPIESQPTRLVSGPRGGVISSITTAKCLYSFLFARFRTRLLLFLSFSTVTASCGQHEKRQICRSVSHQNADMTI